MQANIDGKNSAEVKRASEASKNLEAHKVKVSLSDYSTFWIIMGTIEKDPRRRTNKIMLTQQTSDEIKLAHFGNTDFVL